MVQQTSLTPQEIQARLNQADEIMARVNHCNQQASDQLTTLACYSAGGIYNRHSGHMQGILENHKQIASQYQQLIDQVKSANTKFQQYDS
ncbi:MAG: hypothetical protein J2P17_29945 [Mycobacterium sp.]|nr:hypothetical protein [Mycobacterium sp.]